MKTATETLPKIVSGWSCKSGMGVNTLLLSAAIESANRGYRTAFVELDIVNNITSIKTGLSHPTRNIEKWIEYRTKENAYISLETYLLNSNIWLADPVNRKNKPLTEIVSDMDRNLFFLTPSQSLDRFDAYEVLFYPDTVKVILEQLKSNDFEAIFLDLPSEILSIVTVPAMSLSDEVIVMVDGSVATAAYTRSQLDFLIKEIEPHRIKIVTNRVPKSLVSAVEVNLDAEAWMSIPEDTEMIEYNLDMRNTGGAIFQKATNEFLNKLYLTPKKNYKSSSKVAESEKKGIFKLLGNKKPKSD